MIGFTYHNHLLSYYRHRELNFFLGIFLIKAAKNITWVYFAARFIKVCLNMHEPPVSVIMPVRNASKTLARAIESILDQTLADFELIVIDDGSQDESAKIVKGYQDTRVILMQQSPKGLVSALNKGIEISRAGFIAPMDADDVSYPRRLKMQYDYLMRHPDIGLVSCLVKYCGDRRKNQGYYLHVEWSNQLIESRTIYNRRFMESPLVHPSVMIRKSILPKVGVFKEGPFPEDYEMWLRMMDAGVLAAKLPNFLLDWYDSCNRLSRVDPRYSTEAFFRTKAAYFTKWYRRNYQPVQREIWIWGHGKAVREKSKWLEHNGITIHGFIDLKERKSEPYRTIHYSRLPDRNNPFVLSYVGDRKGKLLIAQYLNTNNFVEGVDYYMMA